MVKNPIDLGKEFPRYYQTLPFVNNLLQNKHDQSQDVTNSKHIKSSD